MNKVGKFEKVNYKQFYNSIKDEFGAKFVDEEIKKMYDNIKLPRRAHMGDAGYDLFAPFSFELKPNEVIKIPTGIRVHIEDGWFLGCFPRSGLGFKYFASLANTVGIIDAPYYYSSNEGHIMAKISPRTPENKVMNVDVGQGFIQGIFLPFGITVDDSASGERDGGFGSSDQKN